jgi:hypothetical protein
MSQAGQMPHWWNSCWLQHYDPAYLRSIDRNFSKYAQRRWSWPISTTPLSPPPRGGSPQKRAVRPLFTSLR